MGHGTYSVKEKGERGSWIKEAGGEDPVNLLDSSLASRVTCEWWHFWL